MILTNWTRYARSWDALQRDGDDARDGIVKDLRRFSAAESVSKEDRPAGKRSTATVCLTPDPIQVPSLYLLHVDKVSCCFNYG